MQSQSLTRLADPAPYGYQKSAYSIFEVEVWSASDGPLPTHHTLRRLPSTDAVEARLLWSRWLPQHNSLNFEAEAADGACYSRRTSPTPNADNPNKFEAEV